MPQPSEATLEFTGKLIIPDTDVYPVEIQPDGVEREYSIPVIEDTDIVIHALYVSHKNPVAIELTLSSPEASGKHLQFKGIFGNEVKPVPFTPPIGTFKNGKVRLKAYGDNATQPVIVNIQYSEVEKE